MYKYIILLLLGAFVSSCDNFLTKETISDLPADGFPSNEKDAEGLVAGMYDAIQTTLETNYFYWGDYRSDAVERNRNNGDLNLFYNTLSPTHATSNWNNIYKVILSANISIKYLPSLNSGDAASKSYMLAEALTVRAWMYFYAVRVWGRVPLITEPYENKEGQQLYYPRADLDLIYTQIEKDLKQAISLFGVTAPSSCYRVSRGLASAILTDFYMWRKDYPNAISASDYFVNPATNTYAYADSKTWKQIFISPETSKENIFVLYWDYASDGEQDIVKQLGGGKQSNAQVKISRAVWNKFVNRKNWDVRFALSLDTLHLYNGVGTLEESSYDIINEEMGVADDYCTKWLELDPLTGEYSKIIASDANYQIPLYRYSGVMLLRAEAFARRNEGNDLSEAVSIVNQIRQRFSTEHNLTGGETQEELIDIIDEERLLELWCEGTRWFDLARRGDLKEVMDQVFINERGIPEGFGDEQYILWPIHQSAFSANPELVGDQNPGYVEG